MESRTLWRSIRRHWIVELLVILIVVGLAAAAAFLPAKKYDATATVVVSAVTSAGETDTSSPDLVTFLMPALQAQVASGAFEKSARDSLKYSDDKSWTASSSIEPDSGVLYIDISSTDKSVVAPVANAYADELGDGIPGQPQLSVSLLDAATTPSAPYSPNPPLLIILGLTLGVILAVLFAAVAGPGAEGRRMRSAAAA